MRLTNEQREILEDALLRYVPSLYSDKVEQARGKVIAKELANVIRIANSVIIQ